MSTPTAAAPEMLTAPKSFTCGKCDGRGRIDAFGHYARGVCFWCDGTGKIQNSGKNKITNSKWYRMQVGNLMHTAEIAMWGAANGNESYCEFYLGTMIADLRKIGTDGAREVLRHIRAGQYSVDSSGERAKIDNATATRLIERVIELGRAS